MQWEAEVRLYVRNVGYPPIMHSLHNGEVFYHNAIFCLSHFYHMFVAVYLLTLGRHGSNFSSFLGNRIFPYDILLSL